MPWYTKPAAIIKKRKDLSQIELASILDVKPPTVNRYLKGERSPNLHVIKEIAEYVGVPAIELVLDELKQPILIQHIKTVFKFQDPKRAEKINRYLAIVEKEEPKELDILLKNLEARISTYDRKKTEEENAESEPKKNNAL